MMRLLIIVFILLLGSMARSAVLEYELTIAEREVNITGIPVRALTVNGGIPGPVLRFTEGDTARIRVHNALPTDSSIHWHGLLVPPEMDGVPYLNFPPIAPGTTFTYEFPIRQHGTYWYHSHSGLQEQRGVYGALVILPREGVTAMRDHTVLLSDWTDEDPHEVLRTLKRGSEWYALQKGSGQSMLGAARVGKLKDYWARELQRMPPMDIADVAYDRFLANGRPDTMLEAAPGETVRLRIVDGSSTTYFHLEFAGGPLTIVAADGQDVEPITEQRLLIVVAETYDVLVKVPATGTYELRATAHDGSGYASVWLGSGMRHPAPVMPKPDLYHNMMPLDWKQVLALTPAGAMGMPDRDVKAGKFDKPGMGHMDGMMHKGMDHGETDHGTVDHGAMGHGTMDHDAMGDMAHSSTSHTDHAMTGENGHHAGGHDMPHMEHATPVAPDPARSGKRYSKDFSFLGADAASAKVTAVDGTAPRPGTPYARLRATRPTVFTGEHPVREIRLTLDGDMERYVWLLNNRALTESDVIRIRAGEVVRFILINRTMMHHPMHLHGHFFRVLNGQGDHAPLKHTVDVAPMATTVIEFEANEVGDWFFHCHLLYHMMSGMARVVHYDEYVPPPALAVIQPRAMQDHEHRFTWGQLDVMTNRTEGFVTHAGTRDIFTAAWEVGWQGVEKTEWEALLTWDRYLNRFTSVFLGADVGNELPEDRAVLGLRYLLPLNIHAAAFIGSDGGARLAAGRNLHLTPRLGLELEAQYDTELEWEGEAVLSYLITRDLSLLANWHSEYQAGAGVRIRF